MLQTNFGKDALSVADELSVFNKVMLAMPSAQDLSLIETQGSILPAVSAFQATMATARPIICEPNIIGIHHEMNKHRSLDAKLQIPNLHLPFESVIFISSLKSHGFVSGVIGASKEEADKIIGHTMAIARAARLVPNGIAYFEIELVVCLPDKTEEFDSAGYDENPEVTACILRPGYLTSNEFETEAVNWLSFIQDKIVEDISYRSRKNKIYINTYRGNHIEKKRVNTILKLSVPKTVELNPNPEPSQHKVEFTHRFEVIGHWRRITGIGRDHEGNKIISGKTWVHPHIKGPKFAPLKKRVRILELAN